MKSIIPEEDRHVYIVLAIIFVIGALLILFIDPIFHRAVTVAGILFTGGGAYWIGSGVILRNQDLTKLSSTEVSEGLKYIGKDPQKMVIPEMLRLQSRRARFGVGTVVFGLILGVVGQYV